MASIFLQVRNGLRRQLRLIAELESDRLESIAPGLIVEQVSSGDVAEIVVPVVAVAPGSGDFRIKLHSDVATFRRRGIVSITPLDSLPSSVSVASVAPGSPLRVAVPEGVGSSVSVFLWPLGPEIVGAFWPWLVTGGPGFELDPASRVLAALEAMRLLANAELWDEQRGRALQAVVAEQATHLVKLQSGDGSFAFAGRASPVWTARCLSALAAARTLHLDIDPEPLRAAASYLLQAVTEAAAHREDPLWWPGGPQSREAWQAEIFRAVVEAAPDAVTPELRPKLDALRDKMQSLLNLTVDPWAIANIGLAELAFADKLEQRPIDLMTALRLVRRVRESRTDSGSFLPSWTDAKVPAAISTAASLELLWTMDQQSAAPLLRDSARAMLTQLAELGGYLDPWAAAWVMRTFAVLPRPARETGASVSVQRGQRVLGRWAFGTQDPVAAALPQVHASSHDASAPRLSVLAFAGGEAVVAVVTHEGYAPLQDARAAAAKKVLSRTTAGETVLLSLCLADLDASGPVLLHVPSLSKLDFESGATGALAHFGIRAHRREQGALDLFVPPTSRQTLLSFPMKARRSGVAEPPSLVVRPWLFPERALVRLPAVQRLASLEKQRHAP